MGLEVRKNFFVDLEDVLDDLKQTGYWPTTLVSEPRPWQEFLRMRKPDDPARARIGKSPA